MLELKKKIFLSTWSILLTVSQVHAQALTDTVRNMATVLPGAGLKQHDFFYAGENGNNESMYVVRRGEVVWSYRHPAKGEISDAVMLSDRSIVFAHQSGVTKISYEKKVLWDFDAPPGCEIHTAQPIGKDRVLFVINGVPSKVLVVNMLSGKTEHEMTLPTGNSGNPHAFFRHARLTKQGTLLVAHLDLQKIAEYDLNGKELWSYPFPEVWSAIPLDNGNILVGCGRRAEVSEINRKGELVWQLSGKDYPGYKFSDMQVPVRLPDGNTLVNNWTDRNTAKHLQAIEVSPDRKMVWALRSWDEPANLGPATTIQILDNGTKPEAVHFGNIR